ncbi:hypothetical protein [Metallosphaera hakonensis]|uniref:hypothetical protein n=1 Tax=Metallosphaera hakonensis TaxID=79601 RepID=UPI0006D198AE|nr:hypothetical protein [Metallosphaera hakonensis]
MRLSIYLTGIIPFFSGFMADEASYSLVSFNIYRINQILVNINCNDAKDILSEYLDVEDIKDLIDVKRLASLILWLKYIGLKVLDVSLFEEPYFIEIDIDDCD